MRVKADAPFVSDLALIRGMVDELGEQEIKQFSRILQNNLQKRMPTGTMDGQTFKVVESAWSGRATKLMGAADAN